MDPIIFGWLGAIASSIVLVPQAFDVIKSKKVRDVSLSSFSLIMIASTLWLIYGVYIKNWPIIYTNAVGLILSGIIVFLKLRYKK